MIARMLKRRVATVSIALTALVPLLLFLVERRLRLAIA
jgi:hypothetical protein